MGKFLGFKWGADAPKKNPKVKTDYGVEVSGVGDFGIEALLADVANMANAKYAESLNTTGKQLEEIVSTFVGIVHGKADRVQNETRALVVALIRDPDVRAFLKADSTRYGLRQFTKLLRDMDDESGPTKESAPAFVKVEPPKATEADDDIGVADLAPTAA